MIILGLDVGRNAGVAIYDTDLQDFLHTQPLTFESKLQAYNDLGSIFTLYRPNACAFGKPTFFGGRKAAYNTFYAHAMWVGIIELLCEKYDCYSMSHNDSTIRAAVLGKGFGHNKAAVHEKYQGETGDVSDAMMFAEWVAQAQPA